LLEAVVATKGRDLIAIADLRAEDTIVVKANKAKTKYKTKSSEDSPRIKRSRLN